MQEYDGEPSAPPDELKYRSENKTPSIGLIPRRLQHAPEEQIGPMVISPYEPPDAVGNQEDRMTDGDNPPAMAPGIHHSLNAAGVGNGHVESKRTNGAAANSPKWGGAMGGE